jgi:HTH-type transcriptional regulator, competence development regulator
VDVTGKLPDRTRDRLVDLGEYIRVARRARGISRKKLADTIGMHVGNYARIEQGKKNVTYETLLRIADGLGVDLSVEFLEKRTPRKKKASG